MRSRKLCAKGGRECVCVGECERRTESEGRKAIGRGNKPAVNGQKEVERKECAIGTKGGGDTVCKVTKAKQTKQNDTTQRGHH